MAADTEEIMCPVCGAKNDDTAARCNACGARIERMSGTDFTESELPSAWEQEDFVWKWVFFSCGVYLVLQAVILVVLPLVISSYDPQGMAGLMISAGVWFVGGLGIGVASPGKTFLEPALGALFAVIPTTFYLQSIADVYELSVLGYLVGGLLGVFVAMLGGLLGEKIQQIRESKA